VLFRSGGIGDKVGPDGDVSRIKRTIKDFLNE